MICLKKIVDDQGGPVEKDTGDIVWVRFEFPSRHDAVKYERGVGLSSHGQGVGVYTSCIGGIRSAEVRIHDVLTAVSINISCPIAFHPYVV